MAQFDYVCDVVKAVVSSKTSVVRLKTDKSSDLLSAGLALEGYSSIIVDYAPVFNKDTLLHALYQSCALPAYFGFNWDALADSLIEVGSQDDNESYTFVLIFNDFTVLEKRSPDTAKIFLEIFEEATQKRIEYDLVPLKVVILENPA